jgi:hypothetical protein
MIQPYTLGIIYNEDGDVKSATIGSNLGKGGSYRVITQDQLPPYVHERIALLRLTTMKEGGFIGRRLNPLVFTIYLTYDEYKELKDLPFEKESK